MITVAILTCSFWWKTCHKILWVLTTIFVNWPVMWFSHVYKIWSENRQDPNTCSQWWANLKSQISWPESQNSKSQANPKSHCISSFLTSVKKCIIKDIELLAAIFTSVVVVYRCCLQLKPVNSTGETTRHWKGLMSNNQQWFGCRISRPTSNHKK